MNAQQRQALQHPAYLAFECSHSRFGRRLRYHSEVVTVNNGYE